MMHKAVFTIEGYQQAYIGYSPHIKSKGIWDIAHFELAEAKRVADGFNECAEHPMEYDPIYDQFFVWDEGNQDYDIAKGKDIMTDEGTKHLYMIGLGNWLWSAVDNRTIYYLAEAIEDFVYEFDTYDYKDKCSDREETVKAIQTQLREFKTFQSVYAIWHSEYLDAESKYNELRKELKL